MDNAIMEANKRHIYFTDDEEEIRVYEMREMALMDEKARLRYAINEGLTQGRKEGREVGKEEQSIEIARRALAENISTEIILKITGLGAETINKLKIPDRMQ